MTEGLIARLYLVRERIGCVAYGRAQRKKSPLKVDDCVCDLCFSINQLERFADELKETKEMQMDDETEEKMRTLIFALDGNQAAMTSEEDQ